jgi:hypothetical protein
MRLCCQNGVIGCEIYLERATDARHDDDPGRLNLANLENAVMCWQENVIAAVLR